MSEPGGCRPLPEGAARSGSGGDSEAEVEGLGPSRVPYEVAYLDFGKLSYGERLSLYHRIDIMVTGFGTGTTIGAGPASSEFAPLRAGDHSELGHD